MSFDKWLATPEVSRSAAFSRAEAQLAHERTIRNTQMQGVSFWPLADQLALARQIMSDITGDEYQRAAAKYAAVIALDAIDEIETERGWTRSVSRGA
jgi:hypothetical protein